MKGFNLSGITRQHILQAIREIDVQHPDLNASTVYDVVYKGRRYPPLELLRLAGKLAHGTAELALAAGAATNTYLEKLGFSVVQKKAVLENPPADENLLPLTDQENVKLVATSVTPEPALTVQEPEKIYRKVPKPAEKYTRKKALAELFLSEKQLSKILAALNQKKNIILQGPPGTGKTFLARRLAYLELGAEDNSYIQTVQFHASYAYEDFIQGFRPDADGKFGLADGVFYAFCKRALAEPEKPFFFIIEEINRGNLAAIFGELLYLLEADKRGAGFGVTLPYGAKSEAFFVPENIYVIATMNTADHALAPLDFALRRRFAFVNMVPDFDLPFRSYLEYRNTPDALIDLITERLTELNQVIAHDPHLGEGFLIGHSYFCHPPKNGGDEDWYTAIVENELAPLLQEYWLDNPEKAKEEIWKLMAE